jgi:hypothetical protein
MKNEIWPTTLMIGGFVAAIVFFALLLFAHLSSTTKVMLTIGQSIGIGVGSIGLGGYSTQARRRA